MLNTFSQWCAISLIRIYQKLRILLHIITVAVFGVRFDCKHSPTCSEYAIVCIRKYGTMRGLLKGFQRILTCY